MTCYKWLNNPKYGEDTASPTRDVIAERDETISQLRANIGRLVKEKDEFFKENVELRDEVDGLQTEMIGLRDELKNACDDIVRLEVELKTKVPEHSLEWAISQMRQGKKVCRSHWVPQAYIQIENGHITYAEGVPFDGTFYLNGWQLYIEPKKELAVGQVWQCDLGNEREIIAIRDCNVVYFYNKLNHPDWVSVEFFLKHHTHKLLGDAE